MGGNHLQQLGQGWVEAGTRAEHRQQTQQRVPRPAVVASLAAKAVTLALLSGTLIVVPSIATPAAPVTSMSVTDSRNRRLDVRPVGQEPVTTQAYRVQQVVTGVCGSTSCWCRKRPQAVTDRGVSLPPVQPVQ